jgi:hypothetical protein
VVLSRDLNPICKPLVGGGLKFVGRSKGKSGLSFGNAKAISSAPFSDFVGDSSFAEKKGLRCRAQESRGVADPSVAHHSASRRVCCAGRLTGAACSRESEHGLKATFDGRMP